MLNRIVRLLGGIPKNEALTEAVKHLYNTIGADDILREEDGKWYFRNKVVTAEQKKYLIEEARTLMGMKLWKVLQADIKYHSNLKMFNKSQDKNDLIAGKLWLYTIDAINMRLKNMTKEPTKFK